MNQAIYITGMGAVTPLGIGVGEYWRSLISGKCGINDIDTLALSGVPITRAAQVKDFYAKEHLPMRLVTDLEPYMQYAYVAAEQALAESRLQGSERVGVIMGTALCGISFIGQTYGQFINEQKHAGPKFLLKAMGNITAAQLAITHKLHGPSITVSTACSSGGDAITLASLLIHSGVADAMVVMAGEAAICPSVIQSLYGVGALSKSGRSLPFDKRRDGFVLGEGGGAIILESEAHAVRRGATPIARLLGCANNTDAFNPVAPSPDGTGATLCIKLALQSAGISHEDIDYINAHGTATVKGDAAEALAIGNVFGNRRIYTSSTKGATGHMMGAGGITEIISCVKAINEGIIPPNLGYEQLDENCNMNIVSESNYHANIKIALSNALGFGGQNSCVIVGKV